MFRIKLCGIVTVEAAKQAVAAGTDCLGLNFFPGSKRYLAPETAADVAAAIPAGVVKVGLFVNASASEVCQIFDRLSLDLIQLHGDEPPEFLPQLGDRPVLRAFRAGPDGFDPIDNYLAKCRQLNCPPRMVLVDSHRPGQFGGTGETGNWIAIGDWIKANSEHQVVLAGGLTPANVAAAIAAVRPAAVDAASGVELAPGIKDPAAMAAFVTAARQAWQDVTPCQAT